MLNLGPIAFASPWIGLALAGLPILWWLLRGTPPAPKLLRFPAIRLLFNLPQDEQTPAKTPLWLVLLRVFIAALVILGLAQPLLNPTTQFQATGPVVVVIDDGWASARGWSMRQRAIDGLIDRAQRAEKLVMVASTAQPIDGGPITAGKLLSPNAARALVQALAPKPWPVSRTRALKTLKAALKAAQVDDPANVVWISNGIENNTTGDTSTDAFIANLQQIGPVAVMADAPGKGALVLPPPVTGETPFKMKLHRAHKGAETQFWLRGTDEQGRVLLREAIRFPEDSPTATTDLALPIELRNRLTRLDVEGVASAGTTVLFDERWRRRPIGIVTAADSRAEARPLLSELYYLERALSPYAEIRKGSATALLTRSLAVLIIPDSGILGENDRTKIKTWMDQGGTVLRFAGPRMGQKPDTLSPVQLRIGGRTLGGAMSWGQPAKLAPFEATSPLAGIALPGDVRVTRQVLAQPTLALPERTWARLADGTPLITAAPKGRGRIVLIHTTANTEWSNLAISGLYIDILRRIISLSQGVSGARLQALAPITTLDGFGRLTTPPPSATSLPVPSLGSGKGHSHLPSPKHPPGFYGNDSTRTALNLGSGIKTITAMAELPPSVRELSLTAREEFDLKPWLLAGALALLIGDFWIGLFLRGLLSASRIGRAAKSTSAALIMCLLWTAPAYAQAQKTVANDSDARVMEATFDTRLAYVQTGNPKIDATSRAGLMGLSEMLRTRTSVEPKSPLGVDIERNELSLFPFLYWPITTTQPLPSVAARTRLARYLRGGGMILLDTRDRGQGSIGTEGGIAPTGDGAARLRQILSGLQVPSLVPVTPRHVLTKSFYLLKEFPGRWTGGTLWVEKSAGNANDGVSSLIIGANDYAAAWATDITGQPLYPVVPGGARQRELSFRFGVNLVMYALTGNYKADQVHVPAILERLGQ